MKRYFKKIVTIIVVTMCFICGCDNNKYDEYIETGNKALEECDYEMAMESFDKALDAKTDEATAKNLYNQTNNYVKAIEQYNKKNFKGCLKTLNKVINCKDGCNNLVTKGKVLKKEVQQTIKRDEDIANGIEECKIYYDNKEYDKAIDQADDVIYLIGKKELTLNNKYDSDVKILQDIKTESKNAKEEENKPSYSSGDENNTTVAREYDNYNEDKENEQNEDTEEENEQNEDSNDVDESCISESEAIEIAKDYYKEELGDCEEFPNSFEIYEIENDKYHIAVNYYPNGENDNDQIGRCTYGWCYVDMYTGEVTK